MAPNLRLTLRYRRSCSSNEILAVDVSGGPSPTASAIHVSSQTSASWVDTFDLQTQDERPMVNGTCALVNPRGTLIATSKDSCSNITIRHVATGKISTELKGARGQPLAWSRDGNLLAVSESPSPGHGRVGVWDIRTGARTGRVLSHIDTVTHAAFTPALDLVTLSRDGTARVTNVSSGKTISRLEIGTGVSANPQALNLTPDGSKVASVWGTTVQIWLPRANNVISYSLGSVRATEGWPLCISTDGSYMACRTEDGFDIMDLSSGVVLWEHKSDVPVTVGAFSPDCKVLLLGKVDGTVEVWDLAKETENESAFSK